MNPWLLLVALCVAIAAAGWLLFERIRLAREVNTAATTHARLQHDTEQARSVVGQMQDELRRANLELGKAQEQLLALGPVQEADVRARALLANAQAQAEQIVRAAEQRRTQVETVVGEHQAAIVSLVEQRQRESTVAQNALFSLRTEYHQAKDTYDRLAAEVAALEENLNDISFGLYKPHFGYETSEAYKAKLLEVYEFQKRLIKERRAVVFAAELTVGNSAKEGERLQKQYEKLVLRAFNGECEAAVAKVTWNNVVRMEERVRKAFDAINSLGGVLQVRIADEYLSSKLDELRIEHEQAELKRRELEEQRAIREQMREEERAEREIEKAQRDAEEDEERSTRALERARAELAKARGAEIDGLSEKIRALEAALAEAHARGERAKSMAEQTRRGYVYVISNHGSFGDDVIKIGMTRRVEPLDRVKELGDASVPFAFDVHGMFFSENAPALENALHRHFAAKRVNLVNYRKEFFRVTLREVQDYANANGFDLQLTLAAEAREYRETLARIAASEATSKAAAEALARSRTSASFPETV